MDIIKLQHLRRVTNRNPVHQQRLRFHWTSSQLASANVTGVAAMWDYSWDGAQDLLVSQQNGKVVLVQNSKTIADGTGDAPAHCRQ